MKKLTVNILGAEWGIFVRKESEETRLAGFDGFCDESCREIVIADRSEEATVRNLIGVVCHTLLHELVHAFMFESGLGGDWQHETAGHDETVVDWMAYQIPKIMEAYKSVKQDLTDMLTEEWNKA